MSWSPTLPGLEEARLFAFQEVIQRYVDDLTESLQRYEWTHQLIPVQPEQVFIGDPEQGWDWNPTTGDSHALRIFVAAGGAREGTDLTSEWQYIGQGAKGYTLYTVINCILHPHTFKHRDPFEQARQREIVRLLLGDWLRAIFNDPYYANAGIQVGSREFAASPAYDRIVGQITTIQKGVFMYGHGGAEVFYGVSATHQCISR